jgi:hypothetical protein
MGSNRIVQRATKFLCVELEPLSLNFGLAIKPEDKSGDLSEEVLDVGLV